MPTTDENLDVGSTNSDDLYSTEQAEEKSSRPHDPETSDEEYSSEYDDHDTEQSRTNGEISTQQDEGIEQQRDNSVTQDREDSLEEENKTEKEFSELNVNCISDSNDDLTEQSKDPSRRTNQIHESANPNTMMDSDEVMSNKVQDKTDVELDAAVQKVSQSRTDKSTGSDTDYSDSYDSDVENEDNDKHKHTREEHLIHRQKKHDNNNFVSTVANEFIESNDIAKESTKSIEKPESTQIQKQTPTNSKAIRWRLHPHKHEACCYEDFLREFGEEEGLILWNSATEMRPDEHGLLMSRKEFLEDHGAEGAEMWNAAPELHDPLIMPATVHEIQAEMCPIRGISNATEQTKHENSHDMDSYHSDFSDDDNIKHESVIEVEKTEVKNISNYDAQNADNTDTTEILTATESKNGTESGAFTGEINAEEKNDEDQSTNIAAHDSRNASEIMKDGMEINSDGNVEEVDDAADGGGSDDDDDDEIFDEVEAREQKFRDQFQGGADEVPDYQNKDSSAKTAIESNHEEHNYDEDEFEDDIGDDEDRESEDEVHQFEQKKEKQLALDKKEEEQEIQKEKERQRQQKLEEDRVKKEQEDAKRMRENIRKQEEEKKRIQKLNEEKRKQEEEERERRKLQRLEEERLEKEEKEAQALAQQKIEAEERKRKYDDEVRRKKQVEMNEAKLMEETLDRRLQEIHVCVLTIHFFRCITSMF